MIALSCPSCDKSFEITPEMAGNKIDCPQCYFSFVIPSKLQIDNRSIEKHLDIPLVQASLQEIVQELSRRGHCAILTLLKEASDNGTGSKSGASSLLGLLGSGIHQDFGVKHLTTEPMDGERLSTLFRLFAKMDERQDAQSESCQEEYLSGPSSSSTSLPSLSGILPSQVPSNKEVSHAAKEQVKPIPKEFSLKGDQLGMSLEDFKARYARPSLSGHRNLPWCSDERPGFDIPDLMTRKWHYDANVIHARIDLPAENLSPTIAGIRTDYLIFQFVDSKLFQITGFFPTDGFHTVSDALRRKFGTPISEGEEHRKLIWWSLDTTIELQFGRLHPKEPACIRYYHDDLLEVAAERKPDSVQDL